MEASAGRIQVGEIHQRQVVTVALVTTDPFIVVQKITAAIENETISINFDRSRMMRRMPVNDRHACLVDESPGQNLLLIRNVTSPIGSPMDRNDDEIARSPVPAALITGIRSDLPGQITAQVTENIYDTPTGRARLIPQGARLIGVYDSQVTFGQSRVLLVWTRLIMPNGRSIVLERQQGADAGGYSGLEDEVDNHWAELVKAALLSTLLGVGAELGSGADTGSNTNILQALRLGAANSLNQTGQQVVRRNLNIQPTLTIRPGFAVRVMVNRDLVLEPYRG